jgi:hypothetical protein
VSIRCRWWVVFVGEAVGDPFQDCWSRFVTGDEVCDAWKEAEVDRLAGLAELAD